MKVSTVLKLFVLLLAVTLITPGCRKRPTPITDIPPGRAGAPTGPGQGGVIGDANLKPTDNLNGIPFPDNAPDRSNWSQDPQTLAADTVYFDFDSSAVKQNQESKIESVASFLKGNSVAAVRIGGYCDERGTEEYNRSLGERRALAVREALVRSGIAPDRVETISYGKDKPSDPGTGEAAWAKNRRCEFVVLTPPK